MAYAKGTSVSVEKSRAEIESMLIRRGARKFGVVVDEDTATVACELSGRRLRFAIEMPDRQSDAYHFTPVRRNRRSPDDAYREWEADCRRLWRSLAAVIKAKFIAIDDGIYSFDEAFLPHIVLPNGKTMAEWSTPQIESAYADGEMPALLPAS